MPRGRQALKEVENRQQALDTIYNFGLERASEILDIPIDALGVFLKNEGLSNEQINLIRTSEAFREGLLQGDTVNLPPELQSVFNTFNEIRGSIRGGLTDAATIRTPDSTLQAQDRATDIAQGGLPSQVSRENVGREIMGQRGQTPGTRVIRDRGIDILNTFGQAGMPELVDVVRTAGDVVATGGRTAETAELYNFGREILAERGFSPELTQAFDTLLGYLSGGENTTTPEFERVFNQLQEVIQSEGEAGTGIMPLNEFVGFAQANAAERSLQLAENAQRDAIRAGLLPGAVTSGTAVDAELSDDVLAAEGQATFQAAAENQRLRTGAMSDAYRNLTSLVISQRNDPAIGAYASAFGDVIRASTINLQTGAQTATNALSLENERFGMGLQGVMQGSQIFAQRENAARQGVLGAEQQELNRMGFGAGLLAQNTQERLQGIGALLDIGQQNMGAQQQTFNNLATVEGLDLSALNSQGGLFLNNQGQILDAVTQMFGIGSNIAQQGQSNMLNASSIMGGFANPFFNLSGQALQGSMALDQQAVGIANQPGFWGSFWSQVLPSLAQAGIGAGFGAIGGALGGGGGGAAAGNGLGAYGGGVYIPGLGTPLNTPTLAGMGFPAQNPLQGWSA